MIDIGKVSWQRLHDGGLNPFAVELVAESYVKNVLPVLGESVRFTVDTKHKQGVTVTLERESSAPVESAAPVDSIDPKLETLLRAVIDVTTVAMTNQDLVVGTRLHKPIQALMDATTDYSPHMEILRKVVEEIIQRYIEQAKRSEA
jgi:hypothetical protein